MGGYGTWDAIQRRPNFFAAAVPICGGGDTSLASKLISLPIWAWHGDGDKVIKPSRSRDMINAISKAGGSPKYSEIKGRVITLGWIAGIMMSFGNGSTHNRKTDY